MREKNGKDTNARFITRKDKFGECGKIDTQQKEEL